MDYLVYLLFMLFIYILLRQKAQFYKSKSYSDDPSESSSMMQPSESQAAFQQKMKEENSRKEKDPVCGMLVNPQKAHIRVYKDKRYYFCSFECADKFSARNHSHETNNS